MKVFRYIIYFIAIVSLAFGLTACQQDSTGPVSKDTVKQQTDQNVKKETAGKKADSKQKADQDKKTDQQRKSAESKKNPDHNKSERSKTTSRPDHTDTITAKQNNSKTAASKEPSDGTSRHHASSPKKSSKQQKGTSHKQTNNSHVTSHRSSTSAANHQTKKQTTNSKPTEHHKTAETVTVSIIGHHQTIVSPTKVPVKKGESMLDATLYILKERGIQYSVRGSGSSAYIEGINNLYEFDDGPLSGWLAKKNGKSIKQSAGITSVGEGDVIQWVYTTNYKKE